MAVTFGPIQEDGTMLHDGIHEVTASNAAANEFFDAMGLPRTVPGQALASSLYQACVDYIAANSATWSQDKIAMWDRIRSAIAAAWRRYTYIGWE